MNVLCSLIVNLFDETLNVMLWLQHNETNCIAPLAMKMIGNNKLFTKNQQNIKHYQMIKSHENCRTK